VRSASGLAAAVACRMGERRGGALFLDDAIWGGMSCCVVGASLFCATAQRAARFAPEAVATDNGENRRVKIGRGEWMRNAL
jgi:hypothetical protein